MLAMVIFGEQICGRGKCSTLRRSAWPWATVRNRRRRRLQLLVDHVKYTDKTRSVIRRNASSSSSSLQTVIVSYAIVRLINSAERELW